MSRSEPGPEFSHPLAIEALRPRPQELHLVASPAARGALAARFDLVAIDRLEAWLEVERLGSGASAKGRFEGDVVQRCVVSGEPVPAQVHDRIALRFAAELPADTDIELEPDALDLLFVRDGLIDLGEAVAQSLLLVLDPYPRASDAVLQQVRDHLTSETEAEALAKSPRQRPFAGLRDS